MLQFIFGRPASGKTYTVLNKITELANYNKQSVLIVPEQFTFESERAVLKVLGDSKAMYVSVMSFTRLYDEIGRKRGGIAGTMLQDSDKIVFMSRALKQVAPDLKLWGKYSGSINFAKTVLDTVGEFKINSISPQKLADAAERVESPALRDKISDIALIYESYNNLIGEKFIDPADRMTKIYEALKDYDFFDGKSVFLDSFKGFTGQQYKIIERILAQADDLTVSFTDDKQTKGEYCIYANIRKAVRQIEAIARSRAVKIAEPIVLTDSRYQNKNLQRVERLLAGQKPEGEISAEGIGICSAQTIFDEAEFAAATIRRLVRTENYRYRDFVIIARDSEKYQSAVEVACKRNGVNCFFDRKIPLSAFPLSIAAQSAINALKFSTEDILNFHKTGLGTLSFDEISTLENYTFVWNIKGEAWNKEWDMNPHGLTASEEENEETTKLLKELNELRLKATEPLIQFKEDFCDNAFKMSKAIVMLFKHCNSAESLSRMSEQYRTTNQMFYADALRQGYDKFMKLLDSLVLCFGNNHITKKEFSDALNMAIALETVGVIPQTLDEVIFGAADRIRPSRPKVAFILGANQGVFPKTITNSGIFALRERRSLIESGIEIPDHAIDSSIDENYLVYSNLSCPSDKLYVSYSKKSLSGEELEPSAFVQELIEELRVEETHFPQDEILAANPPETARSAFSEYCRLLRINPYAAAALKQALSSTEFSKSTDIVTHNTVKKQQSLSPDTAKKLYGTDIYMSATKFDTFYRCHFSYFLRYGLRAEKLQSADFNVLQRGTIVHYCLEKIISEYKKGMGELSDADLDSLCDKYINEYLGKVAGFESVKDVVTEFLVERISRSLKEVLYHIRDELHQSLFEPIACELKIGNDGEIPAIRFPFDSGEIILNGSIDRVDQYNGYIRIIDYKTGSKSFKLPDILFGLNLQMLLYLYCIVRAGGIENSRSGGILYMPSKRDISNKGMAMNGLIPADEDLIRAMDKDASGEFVPKMSLNKDGSISKRSDAFIESEGFEDIFDHIEKLMKTTGNTITSGDISVSPIDGRENNACKYCDYASICGIEDTEIPRVENMSNDKVIEAIRGEDGADEIN